MSYYHNLGPRQSPQCLKYETTQDGQQLLNSVTLPDTLTLFSQCQALSAHLHGLSLHNSIIARINSWYQFQLHTCLNEHPTIFPWLNLKIGRPLWIHFSQIHVLQQDFI